MKKLNFYLNKSVIFSALLVLLIVLGLDFIFSIFEGTGHIRNNYQLPQLVFYSLGSLFDSLFVFLPFILLVSAVIGIARLKHTNELVIIQAAGFSKWQIILSATRFLMIFAILIFVIGEFWQLKFANYLGTYRFEKKWLQEDVVGVMQDSDIWLDIDQSLVRIQLARDDGVLLGITKFEFDSDKNLQKITQAAKASEIANYEWRLEDVKIIKFPSSFKSLQNSTDLQSTEILENKKNAEKIQLKKLKYLDLKLTIDTKFIAYKQTKARQMNIFNLYGYALYLEQKSEDASLYWTYFWRKIFLPFSVFFLIALGASFIFESSRTKSLSFAIFKVLFLGIFFILLQDAMAPLVKILKISPFLAVLSSVLFLFFWGFFRLRKI